jgi:cobalt/nickel transport protein
MNKDIWKFVIAGLVLSLILGIFISPFASPHPDGLEWVAGQNGFLAKAEDTEPAWDKPLIPDYAFPGIDNEKVGTAAAGLVGTLILFGVGWGFAKVISRKNEKAEEK